MHMWKQIINCNLTYRSAQYPVIIDILLRPFPCAVSEKSLFPSELFELSDDHPTVEHSFSTELRSMQT